MDRAELLRDMRAGRVRLQAALAEVPVEQMEAVTLHGAWSVKDLLAHLAFWERRVTDMYAALASTGVWQGIEGDAALDALNEQALREGRQLSLDEVRRWEDSAWSTVLRIAETAPDADMFEEGRFPAIDGRPFFGWIIGNTYGHYDEHLPELAAREGA